MRSQPAAAASSKRCRDRRRAEPRPSSNKCRDRRPAEPRPSSKKCRDRRRAEPRPSSNKCRDRRPAEPRPHLAWLLAGLGVLAAAGSMLTPAGPAAATAVNVGAAPLEPATTGGLATLDRALAKLATHKRLLVIAAHPDDEDTALLTLVSRSMGGEAAYLSLSRGEGGQDLI